MCFEGFMLSCGTVVSCKYLQRLGTHIEIEYAFISQMYM